MFRPDKNLLTSLHQIEPPRPKKEETGNSNCDIVCISLTTRQPCILQFLTLYLYSIQEGSMLALRLPAEIEARLDSLAKETGRTKTYYATQAILEYLEDLEDIYHAEKVIEEIRSGKQKTTQANEVYKELGL